MSLDFSVIIPTLNRPRELAVCLGALAEMGFSADRFEVIVVDDGGDLPLAPIVAEFEDTLDVRCVRRRNGGPALARNTGAASASGRFLAFTDDDCRPKKRWLSALFAHLDEQPEVLVGGKTVNALENSPCSAMSHLIQDFAYDYYNRDPQQARFFASNNMALSAEGFRSIGGFASGFRTAEDRELCDTWTCAGRTMVFVPDAVVSHAHVLDLGSFCRQHIGYGRGARRFQLSHHSRDPSSSTIDGSFHVRILRALPRTLRGKPNAGAQACLFVVWQFANAMGYALEVLNPDGPPQGHA